MAGSRNLFLHPADAVETPGRRHPPLRQRWGVVVAADGTRRLEASWQTPDNEALPAESWYAETA
ncbi:MULTISPECIES: hypothetical protein [Amycolatopsis]|uniref:Uncharacterized protein n=1 Tax=Amycolatopsis albidoflavus TaxID=102226 RepID=A0ABW5HTU8_9PSEU